MMRITSRKESVENRVEYEMKDLDKYRGCLVGGAAGDALGYPVEFLTEQAILARYGQEGITGYELKNGTAEISDDTQMTLFTATGLLLATTRRMTRGISGTYTDYIRLTYTDWYRTQSQRYPLPGNSHCSWLVNQPELFACRAPGITCLSALSGSGQGTIEHPINQSKGCGGIMRVAPIGLYLDRDALPIDQIDRIGAEAAALTHGHSLGYIPAAGLVHMVHLLAHYEGMTIPAAAADMRQAMARQFAGDPHLGEFLQLTDRAVSLSRDESVTDRDAIRALGEGWVAEETLAISLYCALKYSQDFEKALIAAVNHSGDSDSTGSVTGNIVGTYLGYGKIPRKFLERLELKDVILSVADDLYNDCQMTEYGDYYDEMWAQKYIRSSFAMGKRS